VAFASIGVLDVPQVRAPRPSGRKHHISQQLSGLATKAGEICRLTPISTRRLGSDPSLVPATRQSPQRSPAGGGDLNLRHPIGGSPRAALSHCPGGFQGSPRNLRNEHDPTHRGAAPRNARAASGRNRASQSGAGTVWSDPHDRSGLRSPRDPGRPHRRLFLQDRRFNIWWPTDSWIWPRRWWLAMAQRPSSRV